MEAPPRHLALTSLSCHRVVRDVLLAVLHPVQTLGKHDLEALTEGNESVVITAHSKLLREFLFVFLTRQNASGLILIPQNDVGITRLGWGELNSKACAVLASEDFKLSNTGAVSFELEVCTPPECDSNRLILNRCKLDSGGKVYPRNGGDPVYVEDTLYLFDYMVEIGSVGMLGVAVMCMACLYFCSQGQKQISRTKAA